MKNYFDEYRQAKVVLFKLICQFYSYKLKEEAAKKLNIEYGEDDVVNDLGYVKCAFHEFDPEGMYIWEALDLKNPIITMSELWELTRGVKDEKIDETRDYYKEYLELKIVDLYLVERYYKTSIDKKYLDDRKVEYDDIDEYDGMVEGCSHIFESAGEAAWNLFGLDSEFVPLSKIYSLIKEVKCELLKSDIKTKKYRR